MKLETVFFAAGFILVVLLALLLTTIIGGGIGWLVGFVFPSVVNGINQIFGTELTGFQIGAILGFVSGFFSRTVPVK